MTRKDLRTQETEWREAPKPYAPRTRAPKRPTPPKRLWGLL
jgi:hypothetical protein